MTGNVGCEDEKFVTSNGEKIYVPSCIICLSKVCRRQKRERRQDMGSRLSVLKYYLYYKYRPAFSDRKALERWQKKKLKKHLAYVASHCALYRGKTNWQDYPVIEKSDMMENFDRLNTVGIGRKEAEAFAVEGERSRNFAPKLKGITVGLSSGTSGSRGIFLVSDEEKDRWAGYILAKFLPGSIFGTYSIAFFMRADSNLYEAVSSRNIMFHFFDIYRDMEEHRAKLENLKQIGRAHV